MGLAVALGVWCSMKRNDLESGSMRLRDPTGMTASRLVPKSIRAALAMVTGLASGTQCSQSQAE